MLTMVPFLTIRFGLVAGGGVLCAALAIANFNRTTASTPAAAASPPAAQKGDGIAPALKQPVTPPPSFSLGNSQAAAPAPAQPPVVPVAPPKIKAAPLPGAMPAPVAIPDDFAVMPSSRRKSTP